MEENIRLSATNEKCKNCGGDLIFNPKTQNLDCEKCGSSFPFTMVHRTQKKQYKRGIPNQDTLEWARQSKKVKCQTCGAEIELHGLAFTSRCPYCESSYVGDIANLPGLKPDAIVPFAFNEEDALVKFQEGIKKKFFVPRKFKKKLPKNKMVGIYVPTFNFDMDTSTTYKGVLERTVTVRRGKETVRKTERFNISGTKNMIHRNYVIESADNVNDKQITSLLPYDFDKSYEYDPDFIRGHNAKHYEDNLDKCHDLAVKKIEDIIKANILKQYDYDRVISYSQSSIYSNEAYIYRFLPLYNFVFDYNKKQYTVVMNGQTGKVGKGLPISPLKVSILVLLILIAVTLLIILMSMGD